MSLEIRPTTNKRELEEFFLKRPEAHIYALADLEEPFWSHVDAFVAEEKGRVVAAAFLFDMLKAPILYCIAEPEDQAAFRLLKAIASKVPSSCFGHLGLGLADAIGRKYDSLGTINKMQLVQPTAPEEERGIVTELLSSEHVEELAAFYETSAYREGDKGGGFFEPFMLEIGPYFGVRDGDELVAAGGVHVRSPRYKAAALGNVAVAPACRGRGLGTAITWSICDFLSREIETIGLNVHTRNPSARSCYENLGFQRVLQYEEVIIS